MVRVDISQCEFPELRALAEAQIQDFGNCVVELTFRAEYAQSKLIRDFVQFLFEKNGVGAPWNSRFSLISDELVNNSVEYGSLPLDKNTFFIGVRKEEGQFLVQVEVHDTGKGLEAKTSTQMEELRQLKVAGGFAGYLGKRGRGLFQLITNLVDELYFRDKSEGGLVVGIKKAIALNADLVKAAAVVTK